MYFQDSLSDTLSPSLLQHPRRDRDSNTGRRLLTLFLSLLFAGGIGNVILLVTAMLATTVKRHLSWLNFCITWVIFSLSYTVLTLAGKQTGPEPPPGLCLFQAVLIYGAPPLTTCSTAALAVQLWFTFRESLQNPYNQDDRNRSAHKEDTDGRSLANLLKKVGLIYTKLVIVPYIVYLAFITESLVIGLMHQDNVKRAESGVYCSILTGVPGHISATFVLLVMLGTVVLEGFICRAIWRNWRIFKKYRTSGASPTVVARVLLFTACGVAVVSSSIVFLSDVSNVVPNLFLAAMPLMATVIFGTQSDIIRAWQFWRSPVVAPEAVSPSKEKVHLDQEI